MASFRVRELKQKQKKLYFTKMTSIGVSVMVLEKVEVVVMVTVVRGWKEFCLQIMGDR